jgi:hypothetical protein
MTAVSGALDLLVESPTACIERHPSTRRTIRKTGVATAALRFATLSISGSPSEPRISRGRRVEFGQGGVWRAVAAAGCVIVCPGCRRARWRNVVLKVSVVLPIGGLTAAAGRAAGFTLRCALAPFGWSEGPVLAARIRARGVGGRGGRRCGRCRSRVGPPIGVSTRPQRERIAESAVGCCGGEKLWPRAAALTEHVSGPW